MYTIKKLAAIANISTRTLRYYDEIDLLKPTSYTESGYRLYDEVAVDMLQQILLYKTMGMPLNEIHQVIYEIDFNLKEALLNHKNALLLEENRIKTLISTIDKSLRHMEGESMNDKEKFEGIKAKMIEENEKEFGEEARALFGDKVDASNKKIMNMSEKDLDDVTQLTEKMNQTFIKAMETNDNELTTRACEMHVSWIKHYWDTYSKEAHIGLIEMYVMDERFKVYYDKQKEGLAVFVRDSIKKYLN